MVRCADPRRGKHRRRRGVWGCEHLDTNALLTGARRQTPGLGAAGAQTLAPAQKRARPGEAAGSEERLRNQEDVMGTRWPVWRAPRGWVLSTGHIKARSGVEDWACPRAGLLSLRQEEGPWVPASPALGVGVQGPQRASHQRQPW